MRLTWGQHVSRSDFQFSLFPIPVSTASKCPSKGISTAQLQSVNVTVSTESVGVLEHFHPRTLAVASHWKTAILGPMGPLPAEEAAFRMRHQCQMPAIRWTQAGNTHFWTVRVQRVRFRRLSILVHVGQRHQIGSVQRWKYALVRVWELACNVSHLACMGCDV